jgi:type IX secretion system PorP/SprF family membrane protein
MIISKTIKQILNLTPQRSLAVLIIFLGIAFYQTKAQAPVFSQYYASSLYLNPSLAALQPEISLHVNHRVQWQSISPFTTTQASLIYPFLNKKNPLHEHWAGAGLSFFQDQAGGQNNFFKTSGANLNLAFNLYLSSNNIHVLCFGVQAGILQRELRNKELNWGSNYTQGNNQSGLVEEPSSGLRKTVPTFASGLFWYFSKDKSENLQKFKMFFGISAFSLNQPSVALIDASNERLPLTAKLHSGLGIPLSNKILFSPNLLLVSSNDVQQLNSGINISYFLSDQTEGIFAKPELILGSWFRFQDGFIFNAGLNTSKFTLGFSYDLNNYGFVIPKYRGAYEVSLAFKLSKGVHNKTFATPRI